MRTSRSAATSYFDTDDEEVLALRKTYADLLQKHRGGPSVLRRKRSGKPAVLFIIGTERHESRRIDNQLRGRLRPSG